MPISHPSRLFSMGLFATVTAACVATLAVGCQDSGGTTAATTSASGSGGGDATTSASSGQGGASSTSASAGGGSPCDGIDTTVEAITTGQVGPGVKVKLTGLVAMSQKFLVSKGSSSGSCLWGFFASAPGLTETAENTGILVLDYGFNATIDEGQTDAYCPKLGSEEIGDDIPDDVKPGDVLDFYAETANFLLSNCATETNGATVGQYQLAKSCNMVKTGTAPVPAAHVMDPSELEDLASPDKQDFHNKWGGVKVRVENVTAVPGANGGAVGDYGIVTLNEGGLEVGDKPYYRGYLAGSNFCYATPVFDTTLSFNFIDGFSYLDYCTWRIVNNDKCADFDPSSEDCMGAAACFP